MIERVPAPLFAGFAASSLVTETRAAASGETLVAVLLATVVATRSRSLLGILAAGLGGFVLVTGAEAIL